MAAEFQGAVCFGEPLIRFVSPVWRFNLRNSCHDNGGRVGNWRGNP